GSGESANNQVPPATMTSLLRLIQAGSPNLDVVRAGLSVAGKTGSLASRFTGANAIARGQVAATAGAAQLGEVKSQPVRTLISQMLLTSDNTLGEMLARIVSKVSGLDGSLASLQQAIPGALSASFQIPSTGVKVVDGSGESANNQVPPATMTSLLRLIQAGSLNLDVVAAGLSIAGKTGSLASRFTGANAIARGHVAAKVGWIDTEYSLAGTITAADGTVLEFTFYAICAGIKDNAKLALDTLTTAVFSCGDNLSNN
ncbi:MAG: D-alanyl-D-alanine carboxypeptidase, partial [Leifsonia sp.]